MKMIRNLPMRSGKDFTKSMSSWEGYFYSFAQVDYEMFAFFENSKLSTEWIGSEYQFLSATGLDVTHIDV